MTDSKDKNPKHFSFMGLDFHYDMKDIMSICVKVWLVGLVILLVSTYFFGYEMTNADIPCGLLAGFLLSYLLYLLK